ncbi:hypothetical protein B0H14DRAFT_2652180 [Mycena olivaceomarginata]|nr:hypothetical protein B0H14DRAFT_2652180 [Mycena olivaceomarginata]
MPCYYKTHGLQPPSRTNATFRCPKPGCRRRLQPKTARSGANIGRDYIKCYNERHEDLIPAFWFFFSTNATPLPAAPPAAPATPSAAPPAPQAKTCAFGPCQLIKLHRLCPNQLCKRLGVLPLVPVAVKATDVMSAVMEKLERLAARLRMPRMKSKTDTLCFDELQEALDEMLRRTDNGSVLPSAKLFAPVIKPSTARQTMLPKVKTRRARAGDPAYGAGASSGSLAKSSTKKAKSMDPPRVPLPPMPSTAPAAIPSPSALAPPLGYYQFYPYNPHFYSYPTMPAPIIQTYPYLQHGS